MSRAAAEVLKGARVAGQGSRGASGFPTPFADTAVDPDAEKLWQAEILRRAREIDEGSVSELRSRLSEPI
jgi:hypothetical protein